MRPRMAIFPFAVCAAALLVLQQVHAQDVTKKLQFEVASVREDRSDDKSTSNFPLNPGPQFGDVGGVLRARNMVLLQYIVFAYKPNAAQIGTIRQSLPEWTRGVRYDIEAKAAGPATKDEMRLMMQSLLEQRFGMRVHREMQEQPVFLLEVAKPGKLGPKLIPHPADDPDCKRVALAKTEGGSYPHQCGTTAMVAPSAPGLTAIGGQNVTMDHFVLGMTDPRSGVDRPVENHTGLVGGYDLGLEWRTEFSDPNAGDGVSFFDALRQQLGLKLTSGKAPVEVIMVDKVERPTEN